MEEFLIDVCMNEGESKGFLGTDLPPNKDQKVLKSKVNPDHYSILILPGSVKSMEKVRQNKNIIKFINNFYNQEKIIGCICVGRNY